MSNNYSNEQLQQLWLIALASIRHGLAFNQQLTTDYQTSPAHALEHRACFVTLKKCQLLRGCIGSLQACEPLIDNIVHNAFNAAFQDPRFNALTSDELVDLSIQLSILNPSEPIRFSTEQELLSQLRPSVDGLVLYDRHSNSYATFLPSVWQQLNDPEQFLHQLKLKAGLSTDYWSPTIGAERYTVESFSDIVSHKHLK